MEFGLSDDQRSLVALLEMGKLGFFGIELPEELGGGSDAANLRLRARRDDDHYVLDGAVAPRQGPVGVDVPGAGLVDQVLVEVAVEAVGIRDDPQPDRSFRDGRGRVRLRCSF